MSAPYQKNKGFGRRTEVCRYFQRGHCSNSRCPFLHVRSGIGAEGGVAPSVVGSSSNRDGAGSSKGPVATNAATSLMETMLKLVFEKQQMAIYNAEAGLLDLSRLAELPDLEKVKRSVDFNTASFCEALCHTIKQLIVPPPSVLRFDDNGIRSVHHLASALEKEGLHTAARAMSFDRNAIATFDVGQHLKHFVNLQELVLTGNPVAEKKEYKLKMRKSMPFLFALDKMTLAADPLPLPWPQFFTFHGVDMRDSFGAPALSSSLSPASSSSSPHSKRVYSSTQFALLQYIQSAILKVFETGDSVNGGAAGSIAPLLAGVDAVSDLYSPQAVLSLTLAHPTAAVSATSATGAGSDGGGLQRNVVRDIVGFRLRQTESNHNLAQGVKSSLVACGRTKVCSQLEHWLYPRAFHVKHYVHDTANVTFLDSAPLVPLSGGATQLTAVVVPVAIVTLHGVMTWRHKEQAKAAAASVLGGPSTSANTELGLIKRNFSRTLVLSQVEGSAALAPVLSASVPSIGRWVVHNDLISLYPFGDVSTATTSSSPGAPAGGVRVEVILFSPRTDSERHARIGRSAHVPPEVVATLCHYVTTDLDLGIILSDLANIPLQQYEMCAANYTDNDALAAIVVCRIVKRFGVPPETAVGLLKQFGVDWSSIENAIQSMSAMQSLSYASP